MSFEQSPDPQLIEQTKRQIRSLVAEIAQLTKTDVAPEEFYGQFLPRVVSALAAVGGAVWTVNPEGRLALQYQINIQETNLRESEEHQMQHSRLLYKVLGGSEAILVPPHSGPGEVEATDGQAPSNPTDFLLLLGLLKTDLETVGVVEVFQRPNTVPTTQQGYLRFLMQMCELAGDFLKSHQLRHFSDRQSLWTQLEDFTRTVHTSLDPREAAYTIANEGRRLIECDRVSVAIRKGRKCHVEAVSGQDLFDKRSNMIRLLGRLASAVVASGDPIWYTGDTRDLPPQVEEALQEYVDEAHSKTVAVLPLRRPPGPEEDDPKKRVDREQPIGALIVEQIEDSRVTQSLTHRADVVCQHSSTALANALEHQNLFLMPVWRALGKTRWIVEARTLPKTLSIVAAVLAVLLFLGLWPANFTLESKGTLEPVARRKVFAQTDGIVDQIPEGIDHGAMVKKDQLLLQLRNREVEATLTRVRGERLGTIEQVLAVERELTERNLKNEERIRLIGQQAELKQKLLSLDEQLTIYQKKQADLEVHSPIQGEIVTWHLRDDLRDRPVKEGDRLMEMADPAGAWQLELHMPENRMGHISAAQRELGENLEVTYILALEPNVNHKGKIIEIHRSAEVRGDEGNTVLIKVELDKDEMEQLRAEQKLRQGAEVTAKVSCGKRPLGYTLFHDVIEFLQSRVFFRYF
jgi:multidrug efflux pump subunit AcrA (membrane-fusion protein)